MYRILLIKALIMTAPIITFEQMAAIKVAQTAPTAPAKQALEMHYISPFNGWFVPQEILGDYEVGTDQKIAHGGKYSAFLRSKSTESINKAASLRQAVKMDAYRGHEIRLSGYLKSNITAGWAGLWMRVDGEQGIRLSLDNMQNRPIKGATEWTKYELILDVPENSVAITFGLLLVGQGEVWMDDMSLEVLDSRVPTTEVYGKSEPGVDIEEYNRRRERNAKRLNEELKTMPSKVVNLDFENNII